MASLIYTSFWNDLAIGNIDLDTNPIKAMLTTSAYVEDKAHTKRSNITSEVTGAGYTSGGVAVVCSSAISGTNTILTLGQALFTGVSITGRKLVYYHSRGGLATADELIAVNVLAGDLTTAGGNIVILASTITIPN